VIYIGSVLGRVLDRNRFGVEVRLFQSQCTNVYVWLCLCVYLYVCVFMSVCV
jgi:hypothetical protein